jgi:hypothetical protein
MNYADFRKEGYPIGSGSVESEVKQFKKPSEKEGEKESCWVNWKVEL